MMSQLNDIHADIGALQAQMENVSEHLEKIVMIVTTVAIHEERIKNVTSIVSDHEDFIEGSKKAKWMGYGIIIAISTICSTIGTAFANHLLTVHLP